MFASTTCWDDPDGCVDVKIIGETKLKKSYTTKNLVHPALSCSPIPPSHQNAVVDRAKPVFSTLNEGQEIL